jgi:hypothetical protein
MATNSHETAQLVERKTQSELLTYPKALDVMLGEPTFVAEDYASLVAQYGKLSVIMLRTTISMTAAVTTTAIVKVGILGRSMKRVPRADIIEYLTSEDAVRFRGREFILVCSPPINAAMSMVLSDIAINDAAFFSSKLMALDAMDAVMGITQDRANPILQDMLRYLTSVTNSHHCRAKSVEPPVGEWNIYTTGGAIPTPDKLTSAIKGFAAQATRVYPALPEYDADEAGAVIRIHDVLVAYDMAASASQLITSALKCPLFAQLVHQPELFNPSRSPPLEVSWDSFGPELIQNLYSEELTHAAHRDRVPVAVTDKTPFVFTLDELIAISTPNTPASAEVAFDRLNEYVGGYLGELDLSKTMITGSAIAASTIVTTTEAIPYDRNYTDYIAAHYPATKTIPRNYANYVAFVNYMRYYDYGDLDYKTSCIDDRTVLTITLRVAGVNIVTTVLDVLPGADVDMSIVVDSNDAFDAVARGHYDVIQAIYPSAQLEKSHRSDPTDSRYNWIITTRDPAHIATFRAVEMYRASFNHVVTHHVGMVSGAYTALFSDEPKFIMSARHVLATANLASPNYYYFASRKVAPQFVIMKYFARGFDMSAFPAGIRTAMRLCFRDDPVWNMNGRQINVNMFHWPAINAKGYFSAYSLTAEVLRQARLM